MKAIKSIVIILIFLISNPIIAFSKDFRNSNWGMSKNEVKKSEKFELVFENPNSLSYKGTLFDIEVRSVYHFKKNKLVQSSYLFDPDNIFTDNSLREKFNDFNTRLRKKYGSPKTVKDDSIFWKLKTFDVILQLFESKNRYFLQLHYFKPNYINEMNKNKEKDLSEL